MVDGEPYSDIAGASRHSKKHRNGFQRLLADIEGGHFGGEVLLLWENSRGSRREGEWMHLIQSCQEADIKIWVESEGRLYDCSVDRDRWDLLEDAIDSAKEASKISKRAIRAAAANAAAGRPHGPTPFGYRREYDPATGNFVGQFMHPENAELIVELFNRLRKGHSLRSIASDWKTRGILNGRGAPFSAQHLRSLALNPAYMGVRVHDRDRHPTSKKRSAGATEVAAEWPKIIDKELYLTVQDALNAPDRVTTRGGRARHTFSMIIRCGVCGGPVKVVDAGRRYSCHQSGCVRMLRPDVDEFVKDVILRFLASPDVFEALRAPAADSGAELAAVREQLAEARHLLAELADAVADKSISVVLAGRSESKIQGRVDALERRERELTAPTALAGLIDPGPDVAVRWKEATLETQRAVARLLLVPEIVGQARINPSPRPGRQLRDPVQVEERVSFRRLVDGRLVDVSALTIAADDHEERASQ